MKERLFSKKTEVALDTGKRQAIDKVQAMIEKAVELEIAYAQDCLPKGILGLNADYVNQYVQYVADRRLEELGMKAHYGAKNPAKWMAGATDVYELVNFFESQNTSYEVDAHAVDKKKEKAVSEE